MAVHLAYELNNNHLVFEVSKGRNIEISKGRKQELWRLEMAVLMGNNQKNRHENKYLLNQDEEAFRRFEVSKGRRFEMSKARVVEVCNGCAYGVRLNKNRFENEK